MTETQPTAAKTPRYLQKSDYAALRNVSPGYVTRLAQKGMLVMQGKMVDVAKTEALIAELSDPSKQGVKDRHAAARATAEPTAAKTKSSVVADLGQMIDKTGLTYQKGRAVNEHYKALTAKMDYEKAIGKLLLTEDVLFTVSDAAMVLRTRLEAMPDTLAPQLEAERDPARRRVIFMDYVENLLTDISRQFGKLVNQTETPKTNMEVGDD